MINESRLKLMLELFITILPLHEEDEKEQLKKMFGIDFQKLLYGVQYDLFSNMLKNNSFDSMTFYFEFLRQSLDYIEGKSELIPDIPEELLKHFENRKIVIDKDLAKWHKKHG